MLGLLIDVKPYADESLPGYLCRLAEANALEAQAVLELFKVTSGSPVDSTVDLTGGKTPWTKIAEEIRNPHTRPAPVWNIRRRRYCLTCLAEAPYWRAAWDLGLVTACCRHKLQLQDACPHCGAALHWHGPAITKCPGCARSLVSGTADIPAADSRELWITKELSQRLTGSRRHCDQHLKHLGLEDFHELAFRFGCHVSRPTARKPKKVADSGSLRTVRPLALAAGSTLDDWPNGFFKILNQIRADRDDATRWNLAAAIGPIYLEIFTYLSKPEYQFVRDAFEMYVQQRWQAPLALRHRRLSAAAVKGHQWVPVEDVASRFDLEPSFVARLANVGEIPSRTQTYQSGRVACVVNIVEVAQMAPALQNTLTVEETAEALGLPKLRVRQLIDAGILKVWGGAPEKGMRWQVDQGSVQNILRRAEGAPVLDTVDGSRAVFENLLRYRIHGAKQFIDIVSGILSGEVAVVGRLLDAQKMTGWVVDADAIDTRSISGAARILTDLSVSHAARELGVKEEVAYALVRHGFIKSRQVIKGKRLANVIRQNAITAFRHQYVLGVELGTTMKMSPRKVVDFLGQRGAFPVAGPVVANRLCRQYLWRRTKKLVLLTAVPRAGFT
jgi:hypothetical protein